MNDNPKTPSPVGVPKPLAVSENTPSTSELLILPDGKILVHNLTAAFAAVLIGLNPADEQISPRAGSTVANQDQPQTTGTDK